MRRQPKKLWILCSAREDRLSNVKEKGRLITGTAEPVVLGWVIDWTFSGCCEKRKARQGPV